VPRGSFALSFDCVQWPFYIHQKSHATRIISLLHMITSALKVPTAAQIWDVRTGRQSGAISDAHGMAVRDIDFAKQQDNLVVTAGEDCKVRLWDLRQALSPIWLSVADQFYMHARTTACQARTLSCSEATVYAASRATPLASLCCRGNRGMAMLADWRSSMTELRV
jgi:WD40 repeat protein